MPRLLVREEADIDVDQIFATIAQDNLSAALRFYDRVGETYDVWQRGRRSARVAAPMIPLFAD